MAITVSRNHVVGDENSSDGAESDADQSEFDPDDIYHLLQTRRRRDVLRYLRTTDGPVRLRDLAEQVAAWEQETTIENLTSSQRQRVYISLYQSHLPKLDNRGIVDYDKDRGVVTATPLAAQFDPYLAGLEESSEDPWPRRYAGTVGCCSLFLAATAGGIAPASWFSTAVLIVVAFTVVTALHAYSAQVAS
ncbi:hypothetical protein GS429_04165 [Natronorubrum sp. JWXQ-INN-674]|uniref:DUF7344 domain-containing protein n=1 Tax=Natronorubrum halalkaliphilum TaxID=2691917 RepID=A0A6B0VI88_9EURY|nr:hypothetical protein [Natronorubrum halalkaliphilum]MXV61270.1 hypothetical protein [Natronorubrum halalkaliphilum]